MSQLKFKSNIHAEALRTLGRTLPKEQMYILFDAANEIARLEGRLQVDVESIQKQADGHWTELCVQMKRADIAEMKYEQITNKGSVPRTNVRSR